MVTFFVAPLISAFPALEPRRSLQRILTVFAGDNTDGQLGGSTGTADNSTTPDEVAGGHTFRSITCGARHTCSLDEARQAWCWGVSLGCCLI